ncbi:MAG: 2-hydroxyacid dehydrogenase [Pseudomonadota bacterium]|nr:2-hydroxyacid dehydrogenase [Pseudomonadota bacterium]
MKVLLAGHMSEPRAEWLAEQLTTDWTIDTWTEDEPFEHFSELIVGVDAMVGGRIKGEWPYVPNLKLYQVPFTGYEFVKPENLPSGCTLCNAYGHEVAIAEFILAGMLEWEIRLSRYDREFRAKGWQGRKPGMGPSHGELSGKTLGIVGYGHIGKAVAARANAFGMRIIGSNRTPGALPPLERLDGLDQLDRLLEESDYVLTTLPTAPETRGLIDAAKFGVMKKDSVLINVGRAPVVSEQALYEALRDRRIGGAFIDVWYGYPTPEDPKRRPSRYPIWELDNVIMTPHCSSRSVASRERRWLTVPRNLDRLARNEPLENVAFHGTN